jgi:hypothetical protein
MSAGGKASRRTRGESPGAADPLLDDPIGQVRNARGVDDPDDFQVCGAGLQAIEQPDTAAEEGRHQFDGEFVEQPAAQALLNDRCPSNARSCPPQRPGLAGRHWQSRR